MATTPRMTAPMQAVLRSLLAVHGEHPAGEVYGLQLCAQLGLGFGTVYRILARLHQAGWVNKRVETPDAASASRATRIYYRLTGEGADSARQALAEAAANPAGEPAGGGNPFRPGDSRGLPGDVPHDPPAEHR